MTHKELVDMLVSLSRKEWEGRTVGYKEADKNLRRKFNKLIRLYDEEQRKYYEQEYEDDYDE
jgi:t-SNARE complex subunit (syntaxin)